MLLVPFITRLSTTWRFSKCTQSMSTYSFHSRRIIIITTNWDNKDGSDDDEGSSDSNPGHHGGFPIVTQHLQVCHPTWSQDIPIMQVVLVTAIVLALQGWGLGWVRLKQVMLRTQRQKTRREKAEKDEISEERYETKGVNLDSWTDWSRSHLKGVMYRHRHVERVTYIL